MSFGSPRSKAPELNCSSQQGIGSTHKYAEPISRPTTRLPAQAKAQAVRHVTASLMLTVAPPCKVHSFQLAAGCLEGFLLLAIDQTQRTLKASYPRVPSVAGSSQLILAMKAQCLHALCLCSVHYFYPVLPGYSTSCTGLSQSMVKNKRNWANQAQKKNKKRVFTF